MQGHDNSVFSVDETLPHNARLPAVLPNGFDMKHSQPNTPASAAQAAHAAALRDSSRL